MASLFACFKPRPSARLSESGIASLVLKKQSAITAIITYLPSCSDTNEKTNTIQSGSRTQQPSSENVTKTTSFCNGLGILIYPSLLLTTHSTIPSPASARESEINLQCSDTSLSILRRKLLPELFFATDEDLNVTVVACEFVNPALHPLGLDAAKVDARALTMGAKIYVLGHDRNQDSCIKLSVGSAYVISDDDKPLAIRSTGEAWLRGSAGFDHKGNFVLMVTDSEPEDNAYWRNSCVSIRRIKRWLEPQWQSTRSTSSLVVPNRGHDTHLYTRRATYAGRETNCCVDEDFTQGSDQGMRREDASKTTEIYGQHDSENVHGGEAISGNPECAQMKGDGEKLAGKRDDGQRGVRGPIATKSARPSGFGKDVEVTRAPLRGASGVGNGDGARRTGKKVPGRSASMGSLPKGNATTPNKGKGGFGNKGQALETTISSSKGKSKTSAQQQQAPQREQSKSLQLRLHDIPIKDKP